MSLRGIARELGVSPAYLSYMVNGKRPWRPDLREKYDRLVNSVNSDEGLQIGRGAAQALVVGGNGFEPMTSAMSLIDFPS